MDFEKVYCVAMGHLAASLWFYPRLSKWVHHARGVKFEHRASVFLARNVVIDNRYPFLVTLGRDVWLTTGCMLLTHSARSVYQREKLGMKLETGPVTLEDGVFLGAGTIVLPNVTIGKGSFIGAGSVVTGDIPPGVLAAGNPARVIKKLPEPQ